MNAIISWVIRYLGNINASQWAAVLDYVLIADGKVLEGAEKKAWVLEKLERIGIKGWIANFITESALAWLKKKGAVKA